MPGQRVNKFLSKNVETARDDLPITHDTFCEKQGVKAVSSKVPVPPLLRKRDTAALGLLHKP